MLSPAQFLGFLHPLKCFPRCFPHVFPMFSSMCSSMCPLMCSPMFSTHFRMFSPGGSWRAEYQKTQAPQFLTNHKHGNPHQVNLPTHVPQAAPLTRSAVEGNPGPRQKTCAPPRHLLHAAPSAPIQRRGGKEVRRSGVAPPRARGDRKLRGPRAP